MLNLTRCIPYVDAERLWPTSGRHILASYDEETVVVYQAFSPEIAAYAVEHQSFVGCPQYSTSRMTWIKPNFLWMMYRCGWCTKDRNQARVLALSVERDGFEEIIRRSVDVSLRATCDKDEFKTLMDTSDVRCQWDPDHDPSGKKLERRAIQLGLKGTTAQDFVSKWIREIVDITDLLVAPQSEIALTSTNWSSLMVPPERVYAPLDEALDCFLNPPA